MIVPDHIEPPEGPPRSALGRLIATAVDLLCIIDRAGYLRWINPAWERRLGWSSSELKREELLHLVHPADVEDTAAALELLRAGDGDVRFDNRVRCRDGSYRWLQWVAVPMRHGAIYGTARDVTEQKLAEREAEERTRLLMMAEEVAGVGHWRIDLTRDSLTWSREMYRIHGVDPETFTPTVEDTVEAYHPDDRGLVSDHIRDAILLRKDFEFELRLLRPDGSIRHVFSRGKCEVSEDGRPLAVFGVFQDVTERKRLQDRVTHSERMATVGTLAAGVAHEINNPLTWVIANLDAIDRGLEDLHGAGARAGEEIDQLSKLIAEAQQGADQVKRIVRDLLTYSRSQPERLERVDVEEALDIAVNIATNQFKYRASLVRDYGHAPAVVADQSRLTQVFVNLIVNAAQAIPERRNRDGVIELRTSVDEDGRVRVAVSDNGLGMPESVRSRIFDPFYTTKPVGVGTGLGLSISSNIIKSFRGEIEVESQEGKGTRISVVLPAYSSESGTFLMADDDPDKLRVLVVDREARMGRPLSRMLSTDYDVVSLRTGREALAAIDDGERVDAVLYDVDVADMSGLDFFRNVQRVAPHLGDRVAFITGDDDDARELLERTGLSYIDKPIEPVELRELVERLVD
ncbi:MAG: PAS domain-containing protein [Myxococcales bacterium]|nr:PAS domain-containing protein [Myxococcales bacterium]